MTTPNCGTCCVIHSDMLYTYHSPNQLFSHIHFSLSWLHQLKQLSHLQQSPVPLQFLLPGMVIVTNALQKLQAVAMMLCRMAFHLCGKVVVLHFYNSMAKVYLCNQGGTVSPFLSRQTCQILSLIDKHGITLIPAYIPMHLNVEADYLSQDWMLLEWHLLPQVAEAAFHLWGLPDVGLLASSHSTQYQHYYTLESLLPLEALGLNAFNHL